MLDLDFATGSLAPGTHAASLDELEAVFGTGPRRRMLMKGLRDVVRRLQEKGVTNVWIDGSFVSAKARPDDVDVVYEPPDHADTATWGILSFARRKDLKQVLRIDLWPHPSPQPAHRGVGTVPLVEWFRHDRDGTEKGVVQLVLAQAREEKSP